jgi:hypothetical protein
MHWDGHDGHDGHDGRGDRDGRDDRDDHDDGRFATTKSELVQHSAWRRGWEQVATGSLCEDCKRLNFMAVYL